MMVVGRRIDGDNGDAATGAAAAGGGAAGFSGVSMPTNGISSSASFAGIASSAPVAVIIGGACSQELSNTFVFGSAVAPIVCERWIGSDSGDAAVGAAAVDLIVALEEAAAPELANRVATSAGARSRAAFAVVGKTLRSLCALGNRAARSAGETSNGSAAVVIAADDSGESVFLNGLPCFGSRMSRPLPVRLASLGMVYDLRE